MYVRRCESHRSNRKFVCDGNWRSDCEKGLLSFGKARKLAGLSKWEFHELLAAEGIPRHYDVEELEADLHALEELR